MCRLSFALGTVALAFLLLPAIAADNPPSSGAENGVLPTAPAPTQWEQKIKKALENITSIDVADQPLSEWVTFLSDKYQVPIMFDKAALKDAAIDPATSPVDMVAKDISVLSALKMVLSQHNLTYFLTDEVLLITTTDKANARLTVCTYDVHDLVSDPNQGPNQAAIQQLSAVIAGTIATPTWNSAGGPATIQSFANNGICVLVISQTQDVHEQIQQLLDDLRAFKPKKKG